MKRLNLLALFMISLFLLTPSADSVSEDVRRSLINFLQELSEGHSLQQQLLWNVSTDPCLEGNWKGVTCQANSVKIIDLQNLSLGGILDAGLLCRAVQSLTGLYLANNKLKGGVPSEISNCTQLTHLYLGGNRFSGRLPSSLSNLSNLKKLDISVNNFSGRLPDFSRLRFNELLKAPAELLNRGRSGSLYKVRFDDDTTFAVKRFSKRIPSNDSNNTSDQAVVVQVPNELKAAADVYGFGVILIELLTGKLVQNNNGLDLAQWVHSVVKEEWTAEVFDKELLVSGGDEAASGGTEVHKHFNRDRPSMDCVAAMIGAIEEEERSIVSEP